MEYNLLGNISELRNENIKDNLDKDLIYVTTAHLLPDKNGISSSLETSLNKSGKKFYKGDILVSNIRPYFKKIWKAKSAGITSNDVLILKPTNDIDTDYLYYILSQDVFFDYATKTSKGTKMPRGDRKALKRFKVFVPDKFNQKRITRFLLSLDNKIETNNKIITNLEEQAQAIFKSWFVDFEPFQDGEFIESELGLIPKGWEVAKLGKSKLGKLITSGIDEFEDQKIYIATADISDANIINNSTMITYKKRPSRANMQPNPLSVWFAKMKDSRKLILVNDLDKYILENMIFSTGFAGIKANTNSVFFLWTYLISDEFDRVKNSYCQGTTMQAINNSNINKILITMPTDKVLKKFSTLVKPMFDLISRLKYENQKLAEIRDTLLPKLMSGEIDVSGIKIDNEGEINE